MDKNPCILEDSYQALEALVAHFNQRYEFYGRRLSLKYIDSNLCKGAAQSSPKETHAAANEVISRQPFASIVNAHDVFMGDFHRSLAENGIFSIQVASPMWNSDGITDGWTWLASPSLDTNQRLGGHFLCRAFANRNAQHSRDPELANKMRKFAIVRGSYDIYPDTDPLMAALRSCSADVDQFDYPLTASLEAGSRRRQVIQELNSGDYTTLIPISFGHAFTRNLRQWTASDSYYPEFFDINDHHDEIIHDLVFEKPTPGGLFGFTSIARVQPAESEPAFWALNEGGGQVPRQYQIVKDFYTRLLILASGIQMAGPHLTTESFREALWNTTWPNPRPGRPPYWQQRVSFGPGDPVFYDDHAIWWWNEEASSQTGGNPDSLDGRGAFCYLSRGGRFAPEKFPSDADSNLFHSSGPCR